MTPTYLSLEDQHLDAALNGPTPIQAGELETLSLSEGMPVGIGAGNDQPFFSGRSQNVRTTWVEQGWGHDSQRWPAYPFEDSPNPARVRSPVSRIPGPARENYGLDSWTLAEGHEAEVQGYWRQYRRSGAGVHGAIVDTPDGIPYTQTVPTYSGGAVAHPGVDIPLAMLYGG